MVEAPKAANKAKQTFAVVKSPEKSGGKREAKLRNASGGSYDTATRQAPPINLGPNGIISDNANSGQGGKINIREALSEIGIEVEFVGAGCKVVSVREGTMARIANAQIRKEGWKIRRLCGRFIFFGRLRSAPDRLAES
jgi:hypothetical protein